MLRPVVRGETLDPWTVINQSEYVLWPHAADGSPHRELPPLARRWLSPYRETLMRRTDLHQNTRWWSVFRLESAKFDRPRVIWADFGVRPRAIVANAGERIVPLNTCYVASSPSLPDAFALAAILNGPLAAAWLNAIAEPARGGFHRYLGWTMSILPLPSEWKRAVELLAPVASKAVDGCPPALNDLQ